MINCHLAHRSVNLPEVRDLSGFAHYGIHLLPIAQGSACGPTHVARLEFPRENGLILRCVPAESVEITFGVLILMLTQIPVGLKEIKLL